MMLTGLRTHSRFNNTPVADFRMYSNFTGSLKNSIWVNVFCFCFSIMHKSAQLVKKTYICTTSPCQNNRLGIASHALRFGCKFYLILTIRVPENFIFCPDAVVLCKSHKVCWPIVQPCLISARIFAHASLLSRPWLMLAENSQLSIFIILVWNAWKQNLLRPL